MSYPQTHNRTHNTHNTGYTVHKEQGKHTTHNTHRHNSQHTSRKTQITQNTKKTRVQGKSKSIDFPSISCVSSALTFTLSHPYSSFYSYSSPSSSLHFSITLLTVVRVSALTAVERRLLRWSLKGQRMKKGIKATAKQSLGSSSL